METKICTRCKKVKPLTDFHKSKNRSDGLQIWCKPCKTEHHMEYLSQNEDARKRKYQSWIRWFNKNREKQTAHKRKYDKALRVKRRQLVLDYYGWECSLCGCNMPACLTIDHIGGGGDAHRRKVGEGGYFYQWLIKNNFPSGFRTLCWNCQSRESKRIFWENRLQTSRASGDRVGRGIIRGKILNYYGNQCAICGESDHECLEIDHINGGGKKHRKEIGTTGSYQFYRWMINNNFPEGYRALCANCNHSLGAQNRATYAEKKVA